MNYENLTAEQMEAVKACKTPDEMLALAREQGYELSEDELDAVAGGSFWNCEDFDANVCGGDH